MSLINFLIPTAMRARSAAITPYASGIIMPSWQAGQPCWLWNGSSFVTVSGLPQAGYGYVDAATDNVSGALMAQYSALPGVTGGSAVYLASGGSITSYAYGVTGASLLGVAWSPGLSSFYAVNSSGSLFVPSGASLAQISAAWAPTSGAAQLASSGSSLYTILNGNQVGTMALSSVGTGVSGVLSPPLTTVLTIVASGGFVVAAGFNSSVIAATGYVWATLDPAVSSNALFIASGTNRIDLWTNTSENWSFMQSISGTGNPRHAAWSPNGVTAFVTDPVSGKISVVAYSAGTISVSATLTLAGAGPAVFTPAGDAAVVLQPSQNSITPYILSGSVWTPLASISLTSPESIISNGPSGVVVGSSAGINYLQLSGGAWSITASAAMPFQCQSVTMDLNGVVLTAGSSGPSGYLAIVSGTTTLSSTSWPGSGTAIAYKTGRTAVLDPINGLIRVFGPVGAQYSTPTQYSAISGIATNSQQLFHGPISFLVIGPSSIPQFDWGIPYAVVPAQNGAISIFSSGSWTSHSFGVGVVPTAVAFDPSGSISTVTQNNFYKVSVSATVVTSGILPVYPGQPSGTILGISSLLWQGGLLYGSSSL